MDNLIDKIGFGEHTQLIKNNIREWYGNYNLIDDDFHIAAVYNPWSIVNYLSSAIKNPHAKPQDYWANSGSSTELAELIRQAIALDVDKTLNLLEGEEQHLQLNLGSSLFEQQNNEQKLACLLFDGGYLKARH
ncbi:MAG: hypothetical protein MRQ07_02095 [Candidatus Midichloria sp.]|nr:hypothetical protein [Candidatus Midichloria sp.]